MVHIVLSLAVAHDMDAGGRHFFLFFFSARAARRQADRATHCRVGLISLAISSARPNSMFAAVVVLPIDGRCRATPLHRLLVRPPAFLPAHLAWPRALLRIPCTMRNLDYWDTLNNCTCRGFLRALPNESRSFPKSLPLLYQDRCSLEHSLELSLLTQLLRWLFWT